VIFAILRIPGFSLLDNLKDLLNQNSECQSTEYLNGIGGISALNVMIFHAWQNRYYFPFKSGQNLMNFQGSVMEILLPILDYPMIIFFIIGGYLNAKSLCSSLNER